MNEELMKELEIIMNDGEREEGEDSDERVKTTEPAVLDLDKKKR